jgi:hypothetical protein
MTASVLALLSGALLLAVAAPRRLFHRVFGPAIAAQHKLQSRLPNLVRPTLATDMAIARMILLVTGVMLVALGVVSLISVAS